MYYRYEFKSGKDALKVFDFNKKGIYGLCIDKYYDDNSERQQYYSQHPRSDGGEYLAKDMRISDDPWRDFDPANPKSMPAYNNRRKTILPGETVSQRGIYADINCKFLIGNTVVDLGHPYYKQILSQMQDGETVTIGHNPKYCNIPILSDSTVSGQHMQIIKKGNSFIVRDLGSKNKTYYLGNSDYTSIV